MYFHTSVIMSAAPLLYIPGGSALPAESLACCLSTLSTETVPLNPNVKLLEEQLFEFFIRDKCSKKCAPAYIWLVKVYFISLFLVFPI